MARQVVILGVFLVGALAWVLIPSANNPSGSDTLVFSRGYRIGLGAVPAGSTDVQFEVLNAGNEVVHISQVTGSCSCMDVMFSTLHLLPGQSGNCTVTIAIQPNVNQEAAVFFDIAKPYAERRVVLIGFSGFQEDELEVSASSRISNLMPDDQVELEMVCDWRAIRAPAESELITWTLIEGKGISIRSQREVQRSATGVRSVALLDVDARSVDRVSGVIEVTAGMPVRARFRRKIEIPIISSIRLTPNVILVDEEEDLVNASMGSVTLEVTEGWHVTKIAVPDWLSANVKDGRLYLRAVSRPPFDRGVASVVVSATNEDGDTAARIVRCVVDL